MSWTDWIKKKTDKIWWRWFTTGTQWDGNNYSCAYDAVFTILFSIWAVNPKKWNNNNNNHNNSKTPINIFPPYMMDSKNIWEVWVHRKLHVIVFEAFCMRMILFFFHLDTGCSVSALATQMFYPVYKVPQLHLQCSHCNYTIMINSNHVGRLMHVAHSATGSISQIPESHMHHWSQQVCSNCNAPLETKIHFNEPHKIYAIDVTDRNVTLSRTVKIQGLVWATTLHLKSLVYYGGYHFTCWIIDESGNIWFHDGIATGRSSTKEGNFGTVSQPNQK